MHTWHVIASRIETEMLLFSVFLQVKAENSLSCYNVCKGASQLYHNPWMLPRSFHFSPTPTQLILPCLRTGISFVS